MKLPPEWILVGMVKRIHGTGGELLIKPLTDFSEQRFQQGAELFISPKSQDVRQKVTIASSRTSNRGPLVRFSGFKTKESVWHLFGASLFVPAEAFKQPPAGNYYSFQLEGCDVYQGEIRIGRVTSLVEPPKGNPYLEVETVDDKQVRVPFVSQVISQIDLDRQKVDIVEDFLG